MFMATSLMARVAARTGDGRYAPVIGRLLVAYAGKLQRPDGLFVHAVRDLTRGAAATACGVGNGRGIRICPESWPDRAAVLDLYRRQMRALVAHQTDDGAWRQVGR